MDQSLASLTALEPPAPDAGAAPDWAGVEAELGLRLPADYKRLVATYAGAAMGGFLWLLYPGANPNLDLLTQQGVRLGALRQLGAETRPGAPRLDALVAWAITDNGDVCYWLAEPREEPDAWAVVVNAAREPVWEQLPGSATDAVLAVFEGSYRSAIFPPDFPPGVPPSRDVTR